MQYPTTETKFTILTLMAATRKQSLKGLSVIVKLNSVLGQTSPNSTCFDSFPLDESIPFLEDFSVLPSFVPMDAFEQVKNSGKSSKKSANAEVVINSNDKGLGMMNFVHELQVYNNVEKISFICALVVGHR